MITVRQGVKTALIFVLSLHAIALPMEESNNVTITGDFESFRIDLRELEDIERYITNHNKNVDEKLLIITNRVKNKIKVSEKGISIANETAIISGKERPDLIKISHLVFLFGSNYLGDFQDETWSSFTPREEDLLRRGFKESDFDNLKSFLSQEKALDDFINHFTETCIGNSTYGDLRFNIKNRKYSDEELKVFLEELNDCKEKANENFAIELLEVLDITSRRALLSYIWEVYPNTSSFNIQSVGEKQIMEYRYYLAAMQDFERKLKKKGLTSKEFGRLSEEQKQKIIQELE